MYFLIAKNQCFFEFNQQMAHVCMFIAERNNKFTFYAVCCIIMLNIFKFWEIYMKMHVHNRFLAFVALLLISTVFVAVHADITIATYNVTHGLKNDWPQRKAGVAKVIKQLNADIYGFQEVIEANDQLKFMETTLAGYKFIGESRNSKIEGLSFMQRLRTIGGFIVIGSTYFGAQNEYCPIFYNPTKVKLMAHDTFGINGDGSAYMPRIATVGLFEEIATKKVFYVYNSHLDNKTEESRIMQIKLILDDIAQRCGTTPIVIMGDFNTEITGNMKKVLSDADFTQTRSVAQKIEGSTITHGGTQEFECDHLLIRPQDRFEVKLYHVTSTMSAQTSDHDPVSMTCVLK